MKIGVLLARQPEDLGEWLSAAAAFDAAGADALWVDVAGDPDLDPLALTAALAVVTFRSLLVTRFPDGNERMRATIDRLSRGRLHILDRTAEDRSAEDRSAEDQADEDQADEDQADEDQADEDQADEDQADEEAGPDAPRHWVPAVMPDSRADWSAKLRDAAERGARGVVVPADPRLLDLLRNPDEPGDRSDLQLSMG
jgi:hypothetical protein